ncbi:MAG: hypothetical protein AAF770_03685 [Bacteroidota bacterium]
MIITYTEYSFFRHQCLLILLSLLTCMGTFSSNVLAAQDVTIINESDSEPSDYDSDDLDKGRRGRDDIDIVIIPLRMPPLPKEKKNQETIEELTLEKTDPIKEQTGQDDGSTIPTRFSEQSENSQDQPRKDKPKTRLHPDGEDNRHYKKKNGIEEQNETAVEEKRPSEDISQKPSLIKLFRRNYKVILISSSIIMLSLCGIWIMMKKLNRKPKKSGKHEE